MTSHDQHWHERHHNGGRQHRHPSGPVVFVALTVALTPLHLNGVLVVRSPGDLLDPASRRHVYLTSLLGCELTWLLLRRAGAVLSDRRETWPSRGLDRADADLSRTGVDPTQTFGEYVVGLGDRWMRGIDPTSAYDPYAAGLRRRVVPTLGHLPLSLITEGLVGQDDRPMGARVRPFDGQEHDVCHGLVLDEAVRDGLLARTGRDVDLDRWLLHVARQTYSVEVGW